MQHDYEPQLWDFLQDNAHDIAPGPGADNSGFIASEVVEELIAKLREWQAIMESLCDVCKYPLQSDQCW